MTSGPRPVPSSDAAHPAAAEARILVVDDEVQVGQTLVELLDLHGYAVTAVSSGGEALETLAGGAYDLVLTDARMPEMNGFELCSRIRERFGPAIPVVILTAFADAAALRLGFEVGADDFLSKPLDSGLLLLKVRAFLRFKSLHDEMNRNRQAAQARARDLALLHEIGRDWSLIAEPEEFHRMVTGRLAGLIGVPVCFLALYDPVTRTMAAALPVHGMSDEMARAVRYLVKPEYRSLWNFQSGRPYVSNRAKGDPRLIPEMVQVVGMESVVLVPMISEGQVLGLIAAVNKPGGFTEADVQLLSIFAGPAASFLRSRQIFSQQRRHAGRLERVSALMGEMAAVNGRAALLEVVVSRIHADLGYDRVAFHASEGDAFRVEAESGSSRSASTPLDGELLRWALRGAMPLKGRQDGIAELAIPVRAGEQAIGVLEATRAGDGPFDEDEVNLLSALAGQLALALQKAEGTARTERMARQLATLYDLGLETIAQRDLRVLFTRATEEAGRLIQAHHTSVFRFDGAREVLRVFAAWSRDPAAETFADPTFRLGEGIAGRVARDRVPAMVNETSEHPDFVLRQNPVSRLVCVPLTYYEHDQDQPTLFGVLNATRRPGAPAFTPEDLDYLTRFAGQLSIAVANSMAFASERERSEQLALVNALLREISGTLSRERILDTAVRRIHEAFRFPVVSIVVPDTAEGVHRIEAVVSRDPLSAPSPFLIRAGVVGQAAREKRTVVVPDVTVEPNYVAGFASTRSEVAVPIVSGDDVIAILNVESDVVSGFSRSQVITLETLADGIGIILRNAELFEALEGTNVKLVELDRMKSELVNIVAHDFRAPLAGVLGHAELLEWRPDAPRADRIEQAQAIIHAATHMANLVDKTLKTTRLETGQFPFEFGLIDLAAVTRETIKRLPGRTSHPVLVEMPDEPLPCWGDRDRIAEVLDNLVSNAVKYSPDGGTVRLSLSHEGEQVTVKVADEGIGIAAGDMGRLFRPFSRVRNLRTAEIQGSGLGLYICDRIVRAHGGRLVVESRPEEGSVFSFALPLFGASAQVRPPVILVAAGDERTRRDVRRVAEEQGYQIHEVTDGVEAVEAALRLVPAAVMIDRVMPRLGAEEVAERLKDSPSTERVPLFALSESSELGDRASLFAGFLPKPVDREALAVALGGLRQRPG